MIWDSGPWHEELARSLTASKGERPIEERATSEVLDMRLFGNERGTATAIVSIRYNLAVVGYRTGIQSRYLSWRSVMDSSAQRDQLPSACNAHFDS